VGPGLFVSTVGRDEAAVRDYIRRQEEEDKRLDQLNQWKNEERAARGQLPFLSRPEAALQIQSLVSG
jgi:hypothetical protein